ncbi:substrate-binding domain-containing protein [uncultured Martelella sp.]|uniref:substrate-binding domain-containing protein n=1 Tax=uncultured Martelella sp. TaxID=392331 RepID=UPI0029C7BC6C|nr:substrate-binding domain-containing protein [uncultured Martelella sp.]
MTTLRDLSHYLGLSVTQVSRALNGHSDVNADTRLRVEEAAKELNYIPNLSARRLVSGRSGVVGFIERSYDGITRDISLFETVTGLSAAFSERGIQFVLHLTPSQTAPDSPDIIPVFDRLARGGSLDGFVITSPQQKDIRIRHLQKAGIPYVVHGRSSMQPDYPFVDIDNYAIGRRLTSYLIVRGHKRIALISGVRPLFFVEHRYQGVCDVLKENGLSLPRKWLHNGQMTEALGMTSTVRMFSAGGERPTAIICSNLLIAQGVYSALAALGLRVPEDVSVVAHDDVVPPVFPDNFAPSLTVTRSPISESWAPLADFLIAAIEGRPVAESQKLIPYSFVENSSVADVTNA